MLIIHNKSYSCRSELSLNGDWIKLLEKSSGISEYIIALNIDIRNFTTFCQQIDSVDVATYIKKIYMKILKDYFPNVTYSKPMGDGLFLTIKYQQDTLEDLVNTVVDSCIKLVDDFRSLLAEDPMIPFSTPESIGIGLTRGSACCIVADGVPIDYSGKTLNHAARLMDKARPSGLVCDYKGFNGIIKKELRDLFMEDEVCLRGISEDKPIKILYLKDKVLINDNDREPINQPVWYEQLYEYNCSEVKRNKRKRRYTLVKNPITSDIIAIVSCLKPKEDDDGYETTTREFDAQSGFFEYKVVAGKHTIRADLSEIRNHLEVTDTPDDGIVKVRIRYIIS